MTPTDHGPSPRSRSSRAATASVGWLLQRSRGRACGRAGSARAPRRAPSPSRASSAGEKRAELGAGRRGVQAAELRRRGADDRCARSARARLAWISWPATARSSACATVPVRIGRRPRTLPQRLAEQRVVGEAAQELGVVVVEPEHEADVLDARLAVGRDDDRAVGALRRLHALEPARRRGSSRGRCRRRRRGVASLASRPERRSEYGPCRAELGADGIAPSLGRRLSRCCAGSPRGSRCGAASGSSSSSSTCSARARRRRSSTSASPTRRSAPARPTTSSRRSTRGRSGSPPSATPSSTASRRRSRP